MVAVFFHFFLYTQYIFVCLYLIQRFVKGRMLIDAHEFVSKTNSIFRSCSIQQLCSTGRLNEPSTLVFCCLKPTGTRWLTKALVDCGSLIAFAFSATLITLTPLAWNSAGLEMTTLVTTLATDKVTSSAFQAGLEPIAKQVRKIVKSFCHTSVYLLLLYGYGFFQKQIQICIFFST